ncbi:MAG: hypothetical protein QUU85_00065, partial [Candidatus Eisenbacteria bacterium]|nr:hypothetical protein [Candidatus Eisenbacteria bacterium]
LVLTTGQAQPRAQEQGQAPGSRPDGSPAGGASAAVESVRAWERQHTPSIPSLLYTGDAAALARVVPNAVPEPSLVLLTAEGAHLWTSSGLGDARKLEDLLQDYLGEPSVAEADRSAAPRRAVQPLRLVPNGRVSG